MTTLDTIRLDLTPEQALAFATKLSAAAKQVMAANAQGHAEAYHYVGTPVGDGPEVRIRVGAPD